MRSEDLLQIVVIDDIRRFALYVWRYLSRCVGFGTGGIGYDEKAPCPFWKDGPRPLATPAHDAEVWWIQSAGRGENAEITWKDQLDAVLARIQTARRRYFLVDVRWPGGEAELQHVLAILETKGVCVGNDSETEVLLVSSYYTAPRPFRGRPLPVYSKSPETLELLCARLRHRHERPRNSAAIHLLVTGAGFEFKDPVHEFLQLGTRFTATILEEVLASCGLLVGTKPPECRYSCPEKYLLAAEAGDLREAAREGNLDAYWDELLMLEIQALRGKGEKRPDYRRRRLDKVLASRREHAMREAFRQQFLADDWGFLNPALDAVDIPGLRAWITTNYTRFADRAIDLKAAHARRAGQDNEQTRWRIVSTSSEAERLLQELLHFGKKPTKSDDGRFLFKLHGDLAHLLTMAIAGHDKEISSPLSLPISSLHPIYTAAEQYLIHLLRDVKGSVFWHVVGHGLQDELLVQLICSVCQQTRPKRHSFIVVDLFPAGPSGVLRQALDLGDAALRPLLLRADQYLARLKNEGTPDSRATLEIWARRIQPEKPRDPGVH